MASSGWMTTTNEYVQYWIEIIQNSQNIANNTSNVTVKVWIQRRNTGYTTYGTGTVYVAINGGSYSAGITTSQKITETPIVVFTKTLDITHNQDGTKRLDTSAYFSHSAFSSNSQGYSQTLTTIPRASTPTGDDTDGWYWYGQTIKISTNRKSTSFTHTLRYSWGTSNGTIATGVTDSYSWVIPKTFMNLIPNDAWSWGTIYCDTYNGGTFVGTNTLIVYTSVPFDADCYPTFTSVTHVDTETAITSLAVGSYVQSLSKPKFTINGALGAYNSTITKYEVTLENVTYTGNNATAGAIKGSGTVVATATITDSRGRTASKTANLTVLAYAPPVLTAMSVERALNTGVPNALGTYAKFTRAVTWNSLNSKNTLTIVTKSKLRGATNWTTSNTTNAGATGSYNTGLTIGTFSATSSYDFMIEFTDKFNTTLSLLVLSTGQVTMSWGKDGIGIGKVWEKGALDVTGDVNIEGKLTVTQGVGPAGIMHQFLGTTAPTGYLFCNGSAISRTTYADLFAVIGTTYGAGDGSTTFNLPDMRGRVPVGYNSAETEFNALNKTGGAKTHKLTEPELARHWHSIRWMNGVASGSGGYYTDASLRFGYGTGTQQTLWQNGIYADYAGGDQPHNNLQPYITVNYIIKY